MRHFNISGYSTALFGTWYFIEDYNLLFDAGDGLTTQLMQKSRKIQSVFISHADRDHLTGLLQFNQLNARGEYPQIYYPKDCGSFPYFEQFSKQFDPHVQFPPWTGIASGEDIAIKKDLFVRAFANRHKPSPKGQTKSLSFHLIEKRKKLKAELQGLSGEEIKNYKAKNGKDALFNELEIPILSYSGDTPVEYDGRWDNSPILIHEATFLNKEDRSRNNGHSTLEALLEMIRDTDVEQLIIGHFSSRYKAPEILKAVEKFCIQYKVQIPIYAVLPGQTYFDILAGDPVNA
jgi:ribonuclease Z